MRGSYSFSGYCLVLIVIGAGLVALPVDAEGEALVEPSAADEIVAALNDGKLRLLLEEVLERNPKLARLRAEATAVEQRAPQVKALPNPTASLTWFLLTPQTRVGPQRTAINIAQRLPWFGTLKLEEQAALWDTAASRAVLEAARLEVLTDARADFHELQFLDAEENLVREDRTTLEHYSELALARYASGVGIDQAVIKIQAEITRTESRLLEIQSRRATLIARLNSRRDRPAATPVLVSRPVFRYAPIPGGNDLRGQALANRPEVAAARAAAEAAGLRVERSKRAYSPEFVVGLNYGYVSRRSDEAGRLNPPEGNGQDIFGISGGMTVPLWKSSLEAGVEEGVQKRLAAEEGHREIVAAIEGSLGDLSHKIPLLEEQLQLYEDVLLIQARQSLHSAESAYAAGTVGSLDLLDAERVLLQIRTASERVRADLAIARARLEGVIAGPLEVRS